MRLMESLSDHSSDLRVMTARYIRAYSLPHHFLVDRCSEPPCFLSYDVQSHSSQLGIQSRIFGLTFKATIYFQFWVQSHHHFLVMAFKATIYFQLGVQSRIFGLTFRATISFQFGVQSHHLFSAWRSKPHLQFDIQNYHLFSVWHSKPPFLLSYGIKSHHLFLAWRSKPHLWFDIQSHDLFFSLAFRVTILQTLNFVPLAHVFKFIFSAPQQFLGGPVLLTTYLFLSHLGDFG